jgi:hypothetical protein
VVLTSQAVLQGAADWLAGGHVSATSVHHGHAARGSVSDPNDPVLYPFDSNYDIGR